MSKGIYSSVILWAKFPLTAVKVRWAKSQGNILVQNTYNVLTKSILLAVWMCDEIKEGLPNEKQATGIRDGSEIPPIYLLHTQVVRGALD